MKKFTIIPILLFALCAHAQTQYNIYMDSVGTIRTATWKSPQVAISGYYDNLLHIPSISINGVSQSVTNGQAWSTGVLPINVLSKSANYTVLTTDFAANTQLIILLKVDCTSGNLTQTLPTSSLITGARVKVLKTDATSNSVTIANLTGDNVISVQKSVKEVIWDGSSWIQN